MHGVHRVGSTHAGPRAAAVAALHDGLSDVHNVMLHDLHVQFAHAYHCMRRQKRCDVRADIGVHVFDQNSAETRTTCSFTASVHTLYDAYRPKLANCSYRMDVCVVLAGYCTGKSVFEPGPLLLLLLDARRYTMYGYVCCTESAHAWPQATLGVLRSGFCRRSSQCSAAPCKLCIYDADVFMCCCLELAHAPLVTPALTQTPVHVKTRCSSRVNTAVYTPDFQQAFYAWPVQKPDILPSYVQHAHLHCHPRPLHQLRLFRGTRSEATGTAPPECNDLPMVSASSRCPVTSLTNAVTSSTNALGISSCGE